VIPSSRVTQVDDDDLRRLCGVLGNDDDMAEDSMWRHVLYLVCTVEAALLAVALFMLVIDPNHTLSPGIRQVCAISTLVLGAGSCFGAVQVLRGAVADHPWLQRSEPHT
jgi:hypothetical protein